jgi:hypothetical protein
LNRRSVLAALALLSQCRAPPGRTQLVIWAWERSEDLRFAPPQVEIAVQTGFIRLTGERLEVRGRRFPLLADPRQVRTSVVHVEIAPRRPLAWTPQREAEVAAAIVDFGVRQGLARLQVDFEAPASKRPILLGVLSAVRARLPRGMTLSMTAIASWCETETWLSEAPVDEIVPMLFRMGPGGDPIRAKLARGGDFANRRCRSALAISADTPLPRAPAGRRVYLFSPRSWTATDFDKVARSVASWSSAS